MTVTVNADGTATLPALTLTDPAEALELFHSLDENVDRCYRCSEPVWLDHVGVCEPYGAYCNACGHGEQRGCGCEVAA